MVEVPRGTSAPETILIDIPLELVDIGENVRVDPGELAELAASIAELGVLQPIRVVGPDAGGRFRAVWGQRRIMASIIAKRETIPALVDAFAEVNLPGPRRSIEQLAENLQRKDLNPIEEAVALREVLDGTKGLTQDQLADKIGMSRPWVSNTLRLLEIAPEVQARVRKGELSAAHAKAIAAIDVDLQADFAARVADRGMSAHDTEREAKWQQQQAKEIRARKAAGEKAAGEKHAASAIELLDKVANRKRSTIGVISYGSDGVQAALKADGWKVVEGYAVATIDEAGSCGCAGVWRLEVPYGTAGKVQLHPGCNSKEHAEARRTAENAKWEARRAEEQAKREAENRMAEGRAERIAAFLEAELATPFGQRLLLYALVNDGNYLDDGTWTLLEKAPDTDLPGLIAKAVADALVGWQAGKLVIAAVDERLPRAEEPEPPAKPARAKRAAAKESI